MLMISNMKENHLDQRKQQREICIHWTQLLGFSQSVLLTEEAPIINNLCSDFYLLETLEKKGDNRKTEATLDGDIFLRFLKAIFSC